MRAVPLCALVLACCCRMALAQVPDSGRWQELRFSTEAVHTHTEDRYIGLVVDLAARGKLDDDRLLLAKLNAIGAGLVDAAAALKPEVSQWTWEFHTTSDTAVEAICMAGGKILIGSEFVRRLALEDGELAILLAHELAHAVAEHHRETLSEALYLRPQLADALDVMIEGLDTDLSMQIKLSALSSLQEREADQLGMVLAHRAGWPMRHAVAFYTKLGVLQSMPLLAGSHPSAGARQSMARGMARLLDSF